MSRGGLAGYSEPSYRGHKSPQKQYDGDTENNAQTTAVRQRSTAARMKGKPREAFLLQPLSSTSIIIQEMSPTLHIKENKVVFKGFATNRGVRAAELHVIPDALKPRPRRFSSAQQSSAPPVTRTDEVIAPRSPPVFFFPGIFVAS